MDVFEEVNRWVTDLQDKEEKQRAQEREGRYKPDSRPLMQSILSLKMTSYATKKVAAELHESEAYHVSVVGHIVQESKKELRYEVSIGTSSE